MLNDVPDLAETAAVLIGAKGRRGSVEDELIQKVLDATEPRYKPELWRDYTWLGKQQAKWVLEKHPEKLPFVAPQALVRVPDIAIPMLLSLAIGDDRPLNSNTEHPLRLIDDWIKGTFAGDQPAIRNRRALFQAVQNWWVEEKQAEVACRALCMAVSPNFQLLIAEPGSGWGAHLYYGYLTPNELQELSGLWKQVWDVVQQHQLLNWKPFFELLHGWSSPIHGQNPPAETIETLQDIARKIAHDMLQYPQIHSGIKRRIYDLTKYLKLEDPVLLEPDFSILYPEEDFENIEESSDQQVLAAKNLANDWVKGTPSEIVARILMIEKQAYEGEIRFPRMTTVLCRQIAELTSLPVEWAKALIEAGLYADDISPFLRRAFVLNRQIAKELAFSCLSQPHLKGAVIEIVLTTPNMPEDLLNEVIANLSGFGNFVRFGGIRGVISDSILLRLLKHSDSSIASMAAWGEWYHEPKTVVRESFREAWEQVILYQLDDDFMLSEIFRIEHQLAFHWLKQRLSDTEFLTYKFDRAIPAAIEVLNYQQRQELLDIVPTKYGLCDDTVCRLVDDNMELYAEVLRDTRLKEYHLSPLGKKIDTVWIEQAKMAVTCGYDSQAVVSATCFPRGVITWEGNLSSKWAGWVAEFDKLTSHSDERIRHIAQVGKETCESERRREYERERHEAVYGRE